MRSTTRLVFAVDDAGRTVATVLHCEAPQLARVTGRRADGALEVSLVGGAAGPLGGDGWEMDIEVGAGAQVVVRSVAAMLAQPGAHGAPSHAAVRVTVADGAALDWWPEPVVAVRDSNHTVDVTVSATSGARLRWVDEVVLGRHDEQGGRLRLAQRIVVGGRPLSVQDVLLGDDVTAGPGAHGPSRAVVTAVASGRSGDLDEPGSIVDSGAGVRAGRFPLEAGGTAWTALAASTEAARQALVRLGLRRDEALG